MKCLNCKGKLKELKIDVGALFPALIYICDECGAVFNGMMKQIGEPTKKNDQEEGHN